MGQGFRRRVAFLFRLFFPRAEKLKSCQDRAWDRELRVEGLQTRQLLSVAHCLDLSTATGTWDCGSNWPICSYHGATSGWIPDGDADINASQADGGTILFAIGNSEIANSVAFAAGGSCLVSGGRFTSSPAGQLRSRQSQASLRRSLRPLSVRGGLQQQARALLSSRICPTGTVAAPTLRTVSCSCRTA